MGKLTLSRPSVSPPSVQAKHPWSRRAIFRRLPAPHDAIRWSIGRFNMNEEQPSHVHITYIGTRADLIAAGCASVELLDFWLPGKKRLDQDGERCGVHNRKDGTIKLELHKLMAHALGLPGITQESIERDHSHYRREWQEWSAAHAPTVAEPADADSGPTTAHDWKEKQLVYAHAKLRCFEAERSEDWRGAGPIFGSRFQFAGSDVRRLESIVSKFREDILAALEQAAVIDTQQQLPRPSFLRLVVDNTT